MRCINCDFLGCTEDMDNCRCRYLDEEINFDVMRQVPEYFGCPYKNRDEAVESECVQRSRRALECTKQRSLFGRKKG